MRMKSLHKWRVLLAVAMLLTPLLFSFRRSAPSRFTPLPKLSDYGLFAGDMKAQVPAPDVIPYDLNTPLFTDYAYKLRFVKLPPGSTVAYNDREVLDFPVGSILVKTFYYPNDFRKPQKGRRLMETRLLVHNPEGWVALPYIWNDEQTEAYLDVAGDKKPVSFINAKGKNTEINYSIPNMNQCKGCHERNGSLTPIGPSVRQLNRDFLYTDGAKNQLEYWKQKGLLEGFPGLQEAPKLPVWNDPGTGNVESRARAYLDINCGHCHRPDGPANTSGLFLHIYETESNHLGILKAPVAAGKGSGDMKYSIEPGNPDNSILIYRLNSLDPGVMMPEMGRGMVHEEGLALLKEWIKGMK